MNSPREETETTDKQQEDKDESIEKGNKILWFQMTGDCAKQVYPDP